MLVRMSRATEGRIVQDRLTARQDPLRRVRVDALHQQRDPLQRHVGRGRPGVGHQIRNR